VKWSFKFVQMHPGEQKVYIGINSENILKYRIQQYYSARTCGQIYLNEAPWVNNDPAPEGHSLK